MEILKKFEFEMKKEAAYEVDASSVNAKLEEENGLEYSPSEIVLSNG